MKATTPAGNKPVKQHSNPWKTGLRHAKNEPSGSPFCRNVKEKTMSLADELQKLNDLKQSGAITEPEFQQAKDALLAKKPSPKAPAAAFDSGTWSVFIHLSQFLTYLLPLAGIIAPILLWQLKKDESVIIDRHGKIVLNWLLTELILFLIAAPLCLILIGFPLILIISIAAVVFPIIGAIKAANGQIWPYPCSIRFFK